jgi:hypothetical protein
MGAESIGGDMVRRRKFFIFSSGFAYLSAICLNEAGGALLRLAIRAFSMEFFGELENDYTYSTTDGYSSIISSTICLDGCVCCSLTSVIAVNLSLSIYMESP